MMSSCGVSLLAVCALLRCWLAARTAGSWAVLRTLLRRSMAPDGDAAFPRVRGDAASPHDLDDAAFPHLCGDAARDLALACICFGIVLAPSRLDWSGLCCQCAP